MLVKVEVTKVASGNGASYAYPIDMGLLKDVKYSSDMTYCVGEATELIPGMIVVDSSALALLGSLTEMKATKIEELAKHRYALEVSGYIHNGNKFHSDDRAQLKVMQTLQAMQAGAITNVNWKTYTGWVTVDATALQAIYNAGLAHVQSLFVIENTKSLEIAACTTVEAVAAVDIEGGWPV